MTAFAKLDPILKEHLENEAKNAKMTSWKIQNNLPSGVYKKKNKG